MNSGRFLPCGCGSRGGSHMDVLVNSVHMLMLSMVVLLPVLVLPDPEAHVLPLAVLQAIVGPVSVCPVSSRRLKPQCIQRIFWLWLVRERALVIVVVMKMRGPNLSAACSW